MSSEDITVQFKISQGKKFELTLPASSTVLLTKENVEKDQTIPVAQQRLIYRGRILKDPDTLESYGITSGHTIHLVRIVGASGENQQANTTSQSTTPNGAPTVPTAPQTTADPLLGTLGGAGLDANAPNFLGGLLGDSYNGMHPQALQALMSHPAVTTMMHEVMRNPTLLRTMLQANPFLDSMAQNNPMLQAVLSNPDIMRVAMNPDTLQAMMRAQQSYGAQNGTVPTPGTNGTAGTANNFFDTDRQPSPNVSQAGLRTALESLLNPAAANLPQQSRQPPTADDYARHASQLQQLEEMGFIDRDTNLDALQRCGGDVNAAINWLLENGHGN